MNAVNNDFLEAVKIELLNKLKPEFHNKIILEAKQPGEFEFSISGENHGSVIEETIETDTAKSYANFLWFNYCQRILMTATAKADC